MRLSALEQKIFMNIQLGIILVDMFDFCRSHNICVVNPAKSIIYLQRYSGVLVVCDIPYYITRYRCHFYHNITIIIHLWFEFTMKHYHEVDKQDKA